MNEKPPKRVQIMSPKQTRVLELLGQGLNVKQIAAEEKVGTGAIYLRIADLNTVFDVPQGYNSQVLLMRRAVEAGFFRKGKRFNTFLKMRKFRYKAKHELCLLAARIQRLEKRI